ncbi:hypothetical protein ACI79P_15025 [Blastococcus sp. SYSU DS0510]
MPFESDDVVVRRLDDVRWSVVEPLVYRGDRDRFVVPAGFPPGTRSGEGVVAQRARGAGHLAGRGAGGRATGRLPEDAGSMRT